MFIVDFREVAFGGQLVLPHLLPIDAAKRRDEKDHFIVGSSAAAAKPAFSGVSRVGSLNQCGVVAGPPRRSTNL